MVLGRYGVNFDRQISVASYLSHRHPRYNDFDGTLPALLIDQAKNIRSTFRNNAFIQ